MTAFVNISGLKNAVPCKVVRRTNRIMTRFTHIFSVMPRFSVGPAVRIPRIVTRFSVKKVSIMVAVTMVVTILVALVIKVF